MLCGFGGRERKQDSWMLVMNTSVKGKLWFWSVVLLKVLLFLSFNPKSTTIWAKVVVQSFHFFNAPSPSLLLSNCTICLLLNLVSQVQLQDPIMLYRQNQSGYSILFLQNKCNDFVLNPHLCFFIKFDF